MRTTIIVAVLAILGLLIPYLPVRRDTPPSLTSAEPVSRTQPPQRSSAVGEVVRESPALPPVTKRAPTPTSIPDFQEETLSEYPTERTDTLDDLDSFLKTDE